MGGKNLGQSTKTKTIKEKDEIIKLISKALIQHKSITPPYYSSLIIISSSAKLFIFLQSSKDDESTNPSPSI